MIDKVLAILGVLVGVYILMTVFTLALTTTMIIIFGVVIIGVVSYITDQIKSKLKN